MHDQRAEHRSRVNHGALRRVAAGEDYPFGALPDPEIGEVLIAAHRAAAPIVRDRTGAKVGWTVANQALVAAPGAEAKHAEVQHQWEDMYLEPARDDDFVGVQSYTSQLVDEDGIVAHPPHPDNTLMGWAYRPDALGIAVRHTREVVGDVPIVVTENGIATAGRRTADRVHRRRARAPAATRSTTASTCAATSTGACSTTSSGVGGSPRSASSPSIATTFERTPKPSLAWLGKIATANVL